MRLTKIVDSGCRLRSFTHPAQCSHQPCSRAPEPLIRLRLDLRGLGACSRPLPGCRALAPLLVRTAALAVGCRDGLSSAAVAMSRTERHGSESPSLAGFSDPRTCALHRYATETVILDTAAQWPVSALDSVARSLEETISRFSCSPPRLRTPRLQAPIRKGPGSGIS